MVANLFLHPLQTISVKSSLTHCKRLQGLSILLRIAGHGLLGLLELLVAAAVHPRPSSALLLEAALDDLLLPHCPFWDLLFHRL